MSWSGPSLAGLVQDSDELVSMVQPVRGEHDFRTGREHESEALIQPTLKAGGPQGFELHLASKRRSVAKRARLEDQQSAIRDSQNHLPGRWEPLGHRVVPLLGGQGENGRDSPKDTERGPLHRGPDGGKDGLALLEHRLVAANPRSVVGQSRPSCGYVPTVSTER